MGVEYHVYCPSHKELLYLGKWWHLAHTRRLRSDVVERTRRQVARDLPRRGPYEIQRDDRIIELLGAFLDRHKGCQTRGGTDLDKEFEREIGPQLHRWQVFDVERDNRFIQYDQSTEAEKTRNYIQKWESEVILIEERLRAGEISKRQREKTQRWIEDMKSRLRSAKERLGKIEREEDGAKNSVDPIESAYDGSKSGAETAGRHVDVAEQLKAAPFRHDLEPAVSPA